MTSPSGGAAPGLGEEPAGVAAGPSVLVVCTGNVCRSPMAERALQAALDAATPAGRPRTRVTSAGTGALVGHPMEPEAADAVLRAGADPSGHLARALTAADVRGAALVLTATREHRSAVVRLEPAAVRRTFTLREAGRLAAGRAGQLEGRSPAERLDELVALMVRSRGVGAVREPALDDVVDPFRRDAATWALAEEQVLPAVRALAQALGFGPRP